MKKNNCILVIILFACILTSCKKDFLDVNNTQSLYRQSYVKDLSSMGSFLNGVYVMMSQFFEEGRGAAYPDLVADNLKPSSGSDVMTFHYGWSQVSDGSDNQLFIAANSNGKAMDPFWLIGYKLIRACNFVIEDIDKYRSENNSIADDLKGQAYAIRAYVHFKLVNTFAQPYKFTPDGSHPGIPYILTSDITKPFSRQSVAEVYQAAISDLSSAVQLMPETVADTRYMNYDAAKALLARIYLFKEDFSKAITIGKEIATKIPLMTRDNGYPDGIFKLRSGSVPTEALFQLVPRTVGLTNNFLGRYLRVAPIRFYATKDLADILKEMTDDIRRNWIKDTLIAGATYYLVKKFPVGVEASVTTPAISYYPAIIRSSEMFLTVAESAAKTNDENTARTYLNAVRKRANPSIDDVTATGQALIDSIYKERRKELAFESLRLYDLQRCKTGIHRIDVLSPYSKDLNFPDNKAIAPIPYQDFILEGLTQNPGY